MATVVDFDVDQGTTFERTLTFTQKTGEVYPLTGCQLRGHLRENYDDSAAAAELVFVVSELSGTALMGLYDDVTSGLEPISYVYDVELLTATGRVLRCFEGKFRFNPEATK